MVSKLKKVFGGIFAVLMVLALIGACFGEDETAGGEATKSAASNIESRYESQRSDFIHSSYAPSECAAGNNLACKKIEFLNKLVEKCKANDGKACAELALIESKKQARIDRGPGEDFEWFFAKKACELDDADGCSIGLRIAGKNFNAIKYFGEKSCVKFAKLCIKYTRLFC